MNVSSFKMAVRIPPPKIFALVITGALLFSGIYLLQVQRMHGQAGFPLDDSWIHVRVAENIIEGNGFSFNKGIPASVSTEPLWTLLLALALFFLRDPVLAADSVGLILVILTCVFSYKLAWLITRDELTATFGSVIPLFVPSLTWGSLAGMGVPLFVLLTVAGAYYHVLYRWRTDWRQYLPTLAFGLAALARPECFLLFGLSTLHYAFPKLYEDRKSFVRTMLNVALHFSLFALVTSPFFLFNLATSGHPFPNTYYAKNIFWHKLNEGNSSEGRGIGYLTASLSYYVHLFWEYGSSTGWIPLLLLPFGLYHLYRNAHEHKEEQMRTGFLLLIALAYPMILSAQNARVFGKALVYGAQSRYFTNVYVMWSVIGTLGICCLTQKRWIDRKYLKIMILIVTLAVMGGKQWQNSFVYARNVKNVDEMDVAAARWLDENVSKDATIAVNDVGAIAYFSDRRIIDVLGLVESDAWPYIQDGQRGIFEYIKKKRPDYLVVFPKWFPLIVSQEEFFKPIRMIRISDNTIVGSDVLIIYKCTFPDDEPSRSQEESAQAHGDSSGMRASEMPHPSGTINGFSVIH